MLSSILRPKRNRKRVQEDLPSTPYTSQYPPAFARRQQLVRHASADFTATEDDDETEDEQVADHIEEEAEVLDDEANEDEDGAADTPLLPIFSAAHLGL